MLPGMGSAVSGASSLAMGANPAGMALEGVGMAGQVVGAVMGAQAQQGITAANLNINRDQAAINQQNLTQMKLNARRAQMEVVRNQQRARALALNTATAQGASQGSGLSGAYGQIAGMSGTNMLGINQNLAIGKQIATYNQDISNQQMAITKYGGQAATAQGIGALSSGMTSLGSGMVNYGTKGGNQTNPNYGVDPNA